MGSGGRDDGSDFEAGVVASEWDQGGVEVREYFGEGWGEGEFGQGFGNLWGCSWICYGSSAKGNVEKFLTFIVRMLKLKIIFFG